jgi:hypothetical protein
MRVVHLQGAHIVSSSSFDSVGDIVDGVLFLLSMFVVGELGVARVPSLSFGSMLCVMWSLFAMGLLLDLRVRKGMGMMRIHKVRSYFLLPRLVQLGVLLLM